MACVHIYGRFSNNEIINACNMLMIDRAGQKHRKKIFTFISGTPGIEKSDAFQLSKNDASKTIIIIIDASTSACLCV